MSPQPRDYPQTDPNYRPQFQGGYARAEVGTGRNGNGSVLKWLAGVLGAFMAAAMLLLVTCTYNKVDGLSGDMREVRAELKIRGEQYERDRTETERRFSRIERGEERGSERYRQHP